MPKISKLKPRELMHKAIAVMRESVAEFRADDSPSPKVGAVLWQPNGPVVTAARGELRGGNHAEFTLLERKCVSDRLDESVLFTTLEPCLKRNGPKRGCAKHIVSARIKEVYVGIEDDNPVVAGKGIAYLKSRGIKVRMFERDLQEIILEENKVFFEWARRQPEKRESEPIKLSKYEDSLEATVLNDLSVEALTQYQITAGIDSPVDSDEFKRLLRQQGLVTKSGNKLTPTGFGFMLFGKQPRNIMPQAGLLARAELADGTSARKEFNNALVLIPGDVELWLNQVLPASLDRSHMKRSERVDLPFEMIREAVVNALVHRDYDLEGTKCQLEITAETITIKSPGGPIEPITLKEMQSFTAPMKSRNPMLHYVFARMGMAEEQGFGLASLKAHADELDLPLPSFRMEGDSLVLTVYRTKAAAVSTLVSHIFESLSNAERKGWEWLATRDTTTSREYSEARGVPYRTAMNQLKRFQELGLLEKVGTGRSTKYIIHRS